MSKILLNKFKSKNSVNKDILIKTPLSNKHRFIPNTDINKIINVSEQFKLERNNSNFYRITCNINSLSSNVLFNTTGDNSISSFNSPIFRNINYPLNLSGIDLESLSYKDSIDKHLINNNGWFGYQNPNMYSFSKNVFTDMEPNRGLFLLNNNNWDVVVSYPYENKSGYLVDGGLLIIDKFNSFISGRDMITLGLPIKHNLKQGDKIMLYNLTNDLSGEQTVVRLGLDNGDLGEYYFSIDLNGLNFSITPNSRMVKLINGKESKYFYRYFKKIKTRTNSEMAIDDYELFPLAFSKNIYNDQINQLVINDDIDITDLIDNFGRPITEIYISFIKKNNNGFTNIKSGIKIPYIENIKINKLIPDISLITNDLINSNQFVESNVSFINPDFFGDIIEFNDFELIENILGESHYRFNTLNRENGGFVDNISLGSRQEGYYYKPHYKIKIKNFSNYIEQGDNSVIDLPNYANDLGDGRYLWRDIFDNNIYPFLNGCHYINKNISLALNRQDPSGLYGLYYNNFPKDIIGDTLENNLKINKVDDVC